MLRLIVVMIGLLLAQAGLGKVKVDMETSRFELVFAEADAQVKKWGADQVLLVVDLDNTVLHHKHILGSYAWYKWQEKMLSEPDVSHEGRVASSLDELYSVNGLLYSYGSMELTDALVPHSLAVLQKKGVRVLCLTSRGPDYWESTIRDLQMNGLSFADPYWLVDELAYAKKFFSTDVLQSRFSLTSSDIKRYKLHLPVQLMLREGVLFSSGLHKGSVLDLLLKVKVQMPKAIVFVDDSKSHVSSMKDIYSDRELELSVFRYNRYDEEVENFSKKSKATAIRLWNEWQATLRSRDPVKLNEFVQKNFH